MKTAIALALSTLFLSNSFAQPAPSASNVDIINIVTDGSNKNNTSKGSDAVLKSNQAVSSPVSSPNVLSSNKLSPVCACEPKKTKVSTQKTVKKKIVKKSPVQTTIKLPQHVVIEKSVHDTQKVIEVDSFNPPHGQPTEHNFDEYKKWQQALQPQDFFVDISTNNLESSQSNSSPYYNRKNSSDKDKKFIVQLKDLRTNAEVNAYDFKPIEDESVFKVYILNNQLNDIQTHDISKHNIAQKFEYNASWKQKNCSAIHIIYQLKSQSFKNDLVKFIDPEGNISDVLSDSCKLPANNVRDTTFQLKDNAILNISYKEPFFNDQAPLKYQMFLTQEGREVYDVSLQSLVVSEDLSKLFFVSPKPSKSGPYHGVHYEQQLSKGKYRLLTGPVNNDKSWLNTSIDIMKVNKN